MDTNDNNMDPKSPDAKRRLISSIEFTVNEKTQGVQNKRSSRHKKSGQLTYTVEDFQVNPWNILQWIYIYFRWNETWKMVILISSLSK